MSNRLIISAPADFKKMTYEVTDQFHAANKPVCLGKKKVTSTNNLYAEKTKSSRSNCFGKKVKQYELGTVDELQFPRTKGPVVPINFPSELK